MDTKTLEKRIAAALKQPHIGPYELANLLRAENSRANKACRMLELELDRLRQPGADDLSATGRRGGLVGAEGLEPPTYAL